MGNCIKRPSQVHSHAPTGSGIEMG